MREHAYEIEIPQPAARLWALFQRYDLWREYAPAVIDVEVIWPEESMRNAARWLAAHPAFCPELIAPEETSCRDAPVGERGRR